MQLSLLDLARRRNPAGGDDPFLKWWGRIMSAVEALEDDSLSAFVLRNEQKLFDMASAIYAKKTAARVEAAATSPFAQAFAAMPEVQTFGADLDVVVNDRGVVIRGNTREHKDAIKALTAAGTRGTWRWSKQGFWYPRRVRISDPDVAARAIVDQLANQDIQAQVVDERGRGATAPPPPRPASTRAPREEAAPAIVIPSVQAKVRPRKSSPREAIENFEMKFLLPDARPGRFLSWTHYGDNKVDQRRLAVRETEERPTRHGSITYAAEKERIAHTEPHRGDRVVRIYPSAAFPASNDCAAQMVYADREVHTDYPHIQLSPGPDGCLPGYGDVAHVLAAKGITKWFTRRYLQLLGEPLAHLLLALTGRMDLIDLPVLYEGGYSLHRPGVTVAYNGGDWRSPKAPGELIIHVAEGGVDQGELERPTVGMHFVDTSIVNSNWYRYWEVTGVSPSGKSVNVRPIGSRQVGPTDPKHGSYRVEPDPGSFTGSELKNRKVTWDKNGKIWYVGLGRGDSGRRVQPGETRSFQPHYMYD